MKRTVTMMLLVSMLLSAAACGTESGNSENAEIDTTAETVSGDTTAPETAPISRENTPDSLPELDFDGATVRILHLGDDVTRRVETVGEDTGDVVSNAVYNRNLTVEERLNVRFEFIAGNASKEKYMSDLRTVLMSGEDAYDIIDAIQWRALPQALEGLYHNLTDAPYLDYSQPWWADDYMNTIQTSDNDRYLLMGDISVWKLRFMSSMFFNKRLYAENFGDANDLYNIVLDGKWTHELFAKNIKDVYRDLNNDGVTNDGDIIGTSLVPIAQMDHFTYSAGMSYSTRDKDGYPMLNLNHERNTKVVETLYSLCYENPGTLVEKSANAVDNEILKRFTDGQMLYFGILFYMADNLRDMKDEYGIIPFPKLDEEQDDYKTLIHDGTSIFCIPITAKSIDMQCAVLEAMCAESYRTVTPAYYDIALKVKYTHDDISSQIIDMINSRATTDFIYANNYCFSSSVKLGTITRTLMGYNATPSKNYMSLYDSIKESIDTELGSIIDRAKELG